MASLFTTWDGSFYLHLSKYGYEKGSPACAFYPLLPFIIWCASKVVLGNLFLGGIIVTNVASILALLSLHRLISEQQDNDTANISLLLLLSCPGALFFSFIYTEGTFLLLICVFFRCLLRAEYLRAAIVGFFLPLTRATGIFCLAPLLWQLVRNRAQLRSWLCCLGPLSGYCLYFVIMHVYAGDAFEGFQAQQNFPTRPSLTNIVNMKAFVSSMCDAAELHGMTNSLIDRLLFISFIASLPAIYCLNKAYFFYALPAGLIPAMSNWFMSYNRFFILCFPVVVVWAIRLKVEKNRVLLYYVCGVMAIIQICFLIRHVNFYWAG